MAVQYATRLGLGALSITLLLFAAVFTSIAHAQSVGLGTADRFAVLGSSTVTNTGPTLIRGDLGLHPGTAVTGAPQVIGGQTHVNDAIAQEGQVDLTTAYNDARDRSSTGAITADLAGRTLTPGVYTAATSMGLTGDLTLDGRGDPNAVFIFQAGTTLTTGAGSRVRLIGSAQACNVFWQVGASATLGAATAFTGTILADMSITLNTGATIQGRALASSGAVTLDTNTITRSACATPTGTPDGDTSGDTTSGATPDGAAGATPTGTPVSGPRTTIGRATGGPTAAAGPRARGTARLAPAPRTGRTRTGGPRTGPLQGPPGAGRCAAGPFTMRVTGRRIRQVSFFAGGRRLGTVKATAGRTVFSMLIQPRRYGNVQRITARVSFTAASRTATKTLRVTYQRCQSVQPRFTG